MVCNYISIPLIYKSDTQKSSCNKGTELERKVVEKKRAVSVKTPPPVRNRAVMATLRQSALRNACALRNTNVHWRAYIHVDTQSQERWGHYLIVIR